MLCEASHNVGKTTTTEHLGIGLAKAGKKVLLIDFDPQADLTSCLGWQIVDELEATISDVIEASINKKQPDFSEIILHHDEGVDLIPSSIQLADYQLRLVGLFMREKILSNGIETVKKDYDYILIDCPPRLGFALSVHSTNLPNHIINVFFAPEFSSRT